MNALRGLVPATLAGLCWLVSAAAGEELKLTTLAEGLAHPTGVAVQPETGAVFVAESGAGRIVRIDDGKAVPVVTGSKLDVYGKGPEYKIGPLGLTFLDTDRLVTVDGGLPDGEELVRLFLLSGGSTEYNTPSSKAGPLPAIGDVPAEGNFYAVVSNGKDLFITSNGDDAKGWVHRCRIASTKELGKLERFIATKEATGVDAPVGITMSPRGEIVVGQMGEISQAGDSLITFYSARGKKLLNLKTGLNDIAGVAYSPKTGRLYAVDFSWIDLDAGGLFRLDKVDAGRSDEIKAVKMAPLYRPTALAFAPDGTLYLAVIGEDNEDESRNGKILKVAPGL